MEIIFILHHVIIPDISFVRRVTKILILTQNITNCPKILFVFLVSFNIAAHNWLCSPCAFYLNISFANIRKEKENYKSFYCSTTSTN